MKLVIHFSNEIGDTFLQWKRITGVFENLVAVISKLAFLPLVIHFSKEKPVSPNLTLEMWFGNQNSVSSNLGLVIRSGDTVIRFLFSKFTFATVNLNVNGRIT